MSSTLLGVDTARRESPVQYSDRSVSLTPDRLAPKYEELASLYADSDLSSKVTIAKIDATANDVPDTITGFPTIRLYPAGDKESPVEYSGGRTVEDMAEFVKENGKHKADGLTAGKKAQEGSDVTSSAAPSETGEDEDKDAHDEL